MSAPGTACPPLSDGTVSLTGGTTAPPPAAPSAAVCPLAAFDDPTRTDADRFNGFGWINLPDRDRAESPAGVAVAVDVLANDTDPEGDPLAVADVGEAATGGAPANGTVALVGGGVRQTPIPASRAWISSPTA